MLKKTPIGADAKVTSDRKFVLIPRVALPAKFNLRSTPVLISLTNQYTLFGFFPAVYVNRSLTVFKRKSVHLDENLTEHEMLTNGWVKLCWYNPPPANGLRQLLANVIFYLEGLVD